MSPCAKLGRFPRLWKLEPRAGSQHAAPRSALRGAGGGAAGRWQREARAVFRRVPVAGPCACACAPAGERARRGRLGEGARAGRRSSSSSSSPLLLLLRHPLCPFLSLVGRAAILGRALLWLWASHLCQVKEAGAPVPRRRVLSPGVAPLLPEW